MIESLTTAQLALIAAIIGPILTYAGVRYNQRDKLETLARAIVEETLKRQQKDIDDMREERRLDRRLTERLRKAFLSLREGLISVSEQTGRIRDRFDHYFEVRGLDERRELEAIASIDAGFIDLLESLTGLAESTDPLTDKEGSK